MFFTGNKKQQTVTIKTNMIVTQIINLKFVKLRSNIPINGPKAAAKLVLNP